MPPTGQGKKGILVVAEVTGKNEDRIGEQLVGDAGKLLRNCMRKFGLNLDRDFWKTNAVCCRPPNNRKPSSDEIAYCRPNILDFIKKKKPKHIWLLGGTAIESFLGDRFSDCSVTRWRGLKVPDQETGAWLWPMFHPSFVLRKGRDKNLEATFLLDMKRAIEGSKQDGPVFRDYTGQVSCLYDLKEVLEVLQYFSNEVRIAAFDYETSSLQPFYSGQKIWSVSISDSDRAYAFPVDYKHWEPAEHDKVVKGLRTFLRSKTRKIAHNLPFENKWSVVGVGVDKVRNWETCTMTSSHIIDERKSFTGLKFQAFLHFGVVGYDREVDPYKKAKSPRHLNRLGEFPLPKLLMYNGLDALLTYKLYEVQRRIFKRDPVLKEMERLFTDGCIELSDAQITGIEVDELYYKEQMDLLSKKIDNLTVKIYASKEARLFKERTGRKLRIRNKEFSADDLRILFFDIMGMSSTKSTAKGFDSVDKEVLHGINSPFVKRILKRRKLMKVRDTYLHGFLRACGDDGRIHPNWNLNIARSGRSSSSDPNFQNIPTRDEEAKAYARKGVVPSKGNKFGLFDYGSQEVRIIACYSKDPTLINYIVTGGDMHHDQAADIFILPMDGVPGTLRFYAKNQFVFPEFYGSYYGSCARNLWETCADLEVKKGLKVWQHLKSKGITERDFEAHIKEVEERFWNKFPYVREWQKKLILDYRKKGYVSSFFGFRRRGYLTDNKIINTSIQGTAFHCLLWSFNLVSKEARKRWVSSFPVGQIHDEIVMEINPQEEEEVVKVVVDVMENRIREQFDWLIVPLEAEIEMTKVDEAWYYKKEYNT